MELHAATQAFRALGSEHRLAIYIQVASSFEGLPLNELSRRCPIPHEALLLGLSELVGAGLIERSGAGILTWYRANPRRLREALDYAFNPGALA